MSHSIEIVQDGEKGGSRLRTDKNVKRYLSEKRPSETDLQRLYCYRTSTCVAVNGARSDRADTALVLFLEDEHAWVVEQLMRSDPGALVRLGYRVPMDRIQIPLALEAA